MRSVNVFRRRCTLLVASYVKQGVLKMCSKSPPAGTQDDTLQVRNSPNVEYEEWSLARQQLISTNKWKALGRGTYVLLWIKWNLSGSAKFSFDSWRQNRYVYPVKTSHEYNALFSQRLSVESNSINLSLKSATR